MNRKQILRGDLEDRLRAKKRVRAIAKLWADDEEELKVLLDTLMEKKGDYVVLRSHCVEREVNKCIDCGLVENGSNLAAMLTSKDREMSVLAMEIVWDLREKRLKSKTR